MRNRAVFLVPTFVAALILSLLLLENYKIAALVLLGIVVSLLSLTSPLIFLICILIIHEMFFKTIGFGIPLWMYRDISLVLLAVGLILQLFRNFKNETIAARNGYLKYILWLLILVHITTVVGGGGIFHQPVASLIWRSRPFYLYLVFVYLLLARFSAQDIKNFVKFMFVAAVFVSILLIVDAKLLGGGRIFQLAMTDGVSGERVGNVRINSFWFITTWMYFYALVATKFSRNLKERLLYYFALFIISYQLFFVNMGRQLTVMILLATLVFISKLSTRSRFIVICLVVVAFIGGGWLRFMSSSSSPSFFNKVVQLTIYEAQQKDKGNIAVRIGGIKYFYPYFERTAYLGMGLMSSTYKDSPVSSGLAKGYNFADFGMVSTVYRFGIFAVLLIFLLLKKIYKDVKQVTKLSNDLKIKIIAESIAYLFLCMIIWLPSSTIFFKESEALYYGVLLYLIYKLKDGVRHAAATN